MELDSKAIEKTFGLKGRDWQRTLERNLARGMRPEGMSLAIAGYPELHSLTFFLTQEAAERWRMNGVLERPVADEALLIKEGEWEGRAPYLTVIGRNAETLLAIRERNNHGDVTAPWKLFPEHDSYSGFWRQSGEYWMAQVFRPFWTGLSAEERARYLDRWEAPEEWREFLSRL